MKSSDATKKAIQQNLLSMFSTAPGAGTVSLAQPQVVSMQFGHPLIMCQVQFEQDTASVHAEVKFNVVIQLEFPDVVRFSCLKVNFTNPAHNQRLVDNGTENWSPAGVSPAQLQDLASSPSNLVFVPSKQKVFKFGFVVRDQTRIQCAAVVLEYGMKPNALRFQWDVLNQQPNRSERRGSFSSGAGMSAIPAGSPAAPHHVAASVASPLTGHLAPAAKKSHSRSPSSSSKFDFLQPQRSSIEILEHEAFLEIHLEHEEPALVKEFYPIRIRLGNKHDKITSGKLILQNLSDHKDRCFFTTHKSDDGTASKVPVDEIELRPIEHGAEDIFLIHFYAKLADDRAIKVKATYDTEKYSTHCEKVVTIPVKQPLVASFEIYNSQFKIIPPAVIAAPTSLASSNLADTVLLSSTVQPPGTGPATNAIVGGSVLEPKRLQMGEPFYLRVDLQSSVSFNLQLLKIDLLSVRYSYSHIRCHPIQFSLTPLFRSSLARVRSLKILRPIPRLKLEL